MQLSLAAVEPWVYRKWGQWGDLWVGLPCISTQCPAHGKEDGGYFLMTSKIIVLTASFYYIFILLSLTISLIKMELKFPPS